MLIIGWKDLELNKWRLPQGELIWASPFYDNPGKQYKSKLHIY